MDGQMDRCAQGGMKEGNLKIEFLWQPPFRLGRIKQQK